MFCVGWTGTALAQIPVVARMLAAKLLGIDAASGRESPLVDQSGRITKVFPEPFRHIGANIVRKAVQRRVVLEREADASAGPRARSLLYAALSRAG